MSNIDRHTVLIVADAFGLPAYAPRLRSICDHLTNCGWQVDVYTEHFIPLDFPHTYPIHEINIYRNRKWDWAIKTLWSLLTDWKNRYFSRQLLRATSAKHYDLVFCTTFSTFPLRAALAVAKAKHVPLHVDLRDIDEQAPDSQYQSHRQWWARPFRRIYRNINIRRRNRVIRQADMLSSVSPWHVDFLKRYNPNTRLIYNGFDATQFVPQNKPASQFIITYTGRLYEPALQDPTLLFEALQTWQLDKPLECHFYTDNAGRQRLQHLLDAYPLPVTVRFFDYVSPAAVPDLLHQSSILLVISHKPSPDGPHGIMTTKFFESLGVEKPVLCVPSDEDCLAEVIRETNAGIAARNADEIRDFILIKYAEWQKNAFTRQQVNQEKKALFTRQHQAEQFEKLFLSFI